MKEPAAGVKRRSTLTSPPEGLLKDALVLGKPFRNWMRRGLFEDKRVLEKTIWRGPKIPKVTPPPPASLCLAGHIWAGQKHKSASYLCPTCYKWHIHPTQNRTYIMTSHEPQHHLPRVSPTNQTSEIKSIKNREPYSFFLSLLSRTPPGHAPHAGSAFSRQYQEQKHQTNNPASGSPVKYCIDDRAATHPCDGWCDTQVQVPPRADG